MLSSFLHFLSGAHRNHTIGPLTSLAEVAPNIHRNKKRGPLGLSHFSGRIST
jgi:hypothetical protein